MVRLMWAVMPFGVISASLFAAPLVSLIVGWPEGKLTTPISRQKTPALNPVPNALAQASLAAKTLGIASRAGGAALGFSLFDVGENTFYEAWPIAVEGLFHPSDVDEIAAQPDDHDIPRARSMIARICLTAISSPVKTASPMRK